MQEDYMEGLRGQLQQIATNFESLFTAIYKTGVVEDVVKAFADLSSILSKLFENLDNGTTIVAAFVAILTKLGGNAMATGFANMMSNKGQRDDEAQNEAAKRYFALQISENGELNARQQEWVDTLAQTTKYDPRLYSDQNKESINNYAQSAIQDIDNISAVKERRNSVISAISPVLTKLGIDSTLFIIGLQNSN